MAGLGTFEFYFDHEYFLLGEFLNAVYRTRRLTHGEGYLMTVLLTTEKSNGQIIGCRKNNTQLAKYVGTTERVIASRLSKLKRKDFIVVTKDEEGRRVIYSCWRYAKLNNLHQRSCCCPPNEATIELEGIQHESARYQSGNASIPTRKQKRKHTISPKTKQKQTVVCGCFSNDQNNQLPSSPLNGTSSDQSRKNQNKQKPSSSNGTVATAVRNKPKKTNGTTAASLPGTRPRWSEKDLERGRRLREICREKGYYLPQSSPKSLAEPFRLLREVNSAPEELIDQALDWYDANQNDRYAPSVTSSLHFREKFNQILDAMKRRPRPRLEAQKPSRRAKEIASNLGGLPWPPASSSQLPQFTECCLKAYEAAKEKKKHSRRSEHLALMLAAVRPESYIRALHAQMSNLPDWTGDLSNFVWDATSPLILSILQKNSFDSSSIKIWKEAMS